MKICMIGLRGHNGYVFDGLDGDAEIVGVASGTRADDVAPLVASCRDKGSAPRAFEDWRAMLDELRPDVVTIAGPFDLHAEMAVEALRRGIHVFCEKPAATTLADLATLAEGHAASAASLSAMMGLRHDPAFYTAWQAVRQGAVGRVRLISARKSYKLGERRDYYKSRDASGGTIPWVGSHAVDWIAWFSGERFVSVFAAHSRQANRGHGELEMSAMCQFTLTGEVLASASIDYLRPDAAPTHGDDRIRVAGADGVVEVRGGKVYLINAGTAGEVCLSAACDRHVFRDFLAHVRGQGEPLVSGAEVLDVTRACLLARLSADEGRIVQFDGSEVNAT